MKMIIFVIFALMFQCPHLILFSQSELIFNHIRMEDGLPDDGVEWIIQDHLGFIWMATRVGMVKYDGYEFTKYNVGDDDSVGLDEDRIRVLFEDSRGDIWGGADGYLNRYIRTKDTLITYKSDQTDSSSLKGEGVYSIIEDSKSTIWFGIYRGWINYVDKSQLEKNDYNISFKQLKEENHDETYIVYSLFEDSEYNIWACTRNGLLKIKDMNIEVIQVKPGKEFDRNNTFFSILEKDKNKYWVGTYGNGLGLYDDLKKSFNFYRYNKKGFSRYSSNNILSLLLDRKSNLWCGTQGGGLLKFNFNSKSFELFKNRSQVTTSILKGYYHNLFEDNSGTIWIPSFQTGITRIDQSINQIEQYYYGTENKLDLGTDPILCVFEDSKDKIWIGTNNGLKTYDPDTRKFNKVNINSSNFCDDRIVVVDLVEDIKGKLWFHGGWNRKVGEFNPRTNNLKCYGIVGKSKKGLSHPLVSGIEADKNGFVWISTYGGGLNSFNVKTRKFQRHYVAGPENKKDDPEEINRIAQDTSGNIWVASYDRTLNKFDQKNDLFIRNSFTECGGGFNATGMLIDSQNRLWLASRQAGVILIELNTENSHKFMKRDGLPVSDGIRNFFEDIHGNVYCRSNKHLMKFNEDGSFDEYYEFNIGNSNLISASYVKSTDEIFLSTPEQIILFSPGSITPNSTPPIMAITDIQYYDKSFDTTFSLKSRANVIDFVELEYYQNDITLSFVALHYTNPKENQYKYTLENYDDNWQMSGSIRSARYTNLAHGEYLFKTLGSNLDGIWTEIPATLKIIIHPPWWLTWWAYLIYAIVFLSVLGITWMMQLRRIRIKNELKMKEFEAKKLKEVDQMKSNFFANISHEFRTPLTLIRGPIERFLHEEKKDEKKEVLKMILRNTKKLLNLINELLDLSKLEAGKMKLCAGKYDIISYTKGIVMSFKSLAESKEIKLSVKSEKSFVEIYFDKEKMQKIISNLVSNALKFTPERGNIDVLLQENFTEDKLIIKIIDSGIGVPEKELPKLFDRFYQVIRNGTEGHSGTGIGLALTKELISIHKGTIDVESEVERGTTFTIKLPLGKDHLSDNEILLRPDEELDIDTIELIRIDGDESKNSNRPLILVVEDNHDVLKFIKDTLKSNYQVIFAVNGSEGYKRATEKIPDLIISDIMMPLMDGNKMCELIKNDERTSHIPIILLTAKASEEAKIEGLKTGVDDYIIKPFDPLELIVRVNNLILQRRKLREKYLKEAEIHPAEVAVTSTDKVFLEKAIKYVEKHLSDPSLGVEELAEHLSMSRSQLYRKLCAVLGEKPNEFIRKYRLKRAADLFKQNFGNIAQIAFEVGFNDPAYFSKCFKKLFNKTPVEYERELIKEKDLENKY